jgi:hypothetical protein
MITTKTRALLVAMTLIGAAPATINAFADNIIAIGIEDNDEVKQENEAKVEQKQEVEGLANVGSGEGDTTGDQTNAVGQGQSSTITQSNTNTNNNVAVVQAVQDDRDICSDLFSSLGICVDADDEDGADD